MTTIENAQQLDTLPEGVTITVQQPGSPRKQYRAEGAGYFREAREGARALPARFFRGAVTAGFISLTQPGEEPEEDFDQTQWVVGGFYAMPGDFTVVYQAMDEDMSGNVHNCMSINGSRWSRSVIAQYQLDSGSYVRITEEEARNSQTDWYWKWRDATDKKDEKAAPPTDLIAAVKEYALGEKDGVLAGILQENGVDMSVVTSATVTGTTTLTAEQVAAILGGGVTTDKSMSSDWTRTFDVKVQRGCICDKGWEEVVVNPNDVHVNLPASRDTFSVALVCREHAKKG